MRALRLWATVVALLVVALLADSMILAATGGTRLLDPYLILTVWYGAHGRKADGMLVGALAGLVQDTLDSVVLAQRISKSEFLASQEVANSAVVDQFEAALASDDFEAALAALDFGDDD